MSESKVPLKLKLTFLDPNKIEQAMAFSSRFGALCFAQMFGCTDTLSSSFVVCRALPLSVSTWVHTMCSELGSYTGL